MDGIEKSTYLVFRRGRDPEKLRLGNLVVFPRNPEESDPHLCPYKTSELHEWTNEPMKEPTLTVEISDSHDLQASVYATSLVGGAVSGSGGSRLRIEGKNARRFQIDQASEFLDRVILSSPEARKWLNSRITVARSIYYLNRLKLGKSRYPQIWVVTGIQLLSDVTVRNERSSSAKASATVQVPPPELASAAIAALSASTSGIGANASISKDGESSVEYRHTDERVWAAQFRRLKIDFIKQGDAQSLRDISIHDLLDLGRLGIRADVPPESDETSQIGGVQEDDGGQMQDATTEEDRLLFDKFMATSKKHALLIGGSEKSLRGVRRDLQAMSDLLLGLEFDVSLCYGDRATRAGIIRAWHHLVQKTSKNDAVVVYYSGHGGCIEPNASTETDRIQYIIPADMEKTTGQDFRGILDVELSYLVTCLTKRTHNVTIVLDCCHSERAARADGPPPPGLRAWSPARQKDIEAHIGRLREAGFFKRRLHVEGNPYSVRVVAAESDKPAFEGPVSKGLASEVSDDGVMGNLTRELVEEILRIGENTTSWDAVLPQLRLKLEGGTKSQRPQIEGPKMRALFSLDRLDYWGQLGLKVKGDRVSLMGGILAQVREGDQYAIMPRTALSIHPAEQIAVATVQSVWPTTADVTLQYMNGRSAIPDGVRAFPLRRFRPGYGVEVRAADASLVSYLHSRLGKARFIYDFETSFGDEVAFATIEQGDGKLVLRHRNEEPTLEYPTPTNVGYEDAVEDAIYQLEKLARADQVRTLVPREIDALDISSVSIEAGSVDRGVTAPFQGGKDDWISEGQSAYLKIQNNGESTIFAAVFLVTGIGTIEWLSYGFPSGAELRPGAAYIPGQKAHSRDKKIKGFKFVWPTWIPHNGPLRESFVVILTSGKTDLGFLGTQYRKDVPARELAEETDDDEDEDLCFSVRRIDFNFVPKKSAPTLMLAELAERTRRS